MTSEWKLQVGAVVNVVGPRLRHIGVALERAEAEVAPLLGDDFLPGTPFDTVQLVVHFGERTDLVAKRRRPSGRYVRTAVELSYEELRKVRSEAEFVDAFRRAVIEALVSVADANGSPAAALRRARAKT